MNYSIKGTKRIRVRELIRKAGSILLVIVIIEAGILLLRSLSIKTVVTKWDRIEKGYWTDALFLRKETLLRSPLDGNMVIEVESGARVPRGELLLYISTDQPVNTSELNIKAKMELESLIREEQASRVQLARIETEIKETQRSSKSAKKLKTATAVITELRNEKLRVTEILQVTHLKLVALQRKIKDQLGQQALIMAPEPGYVYYQYDGFEDQMPPEDFKGLKEEDVRRNYGLKNPGPKVKAGEIIGKIIDPFKQLVVISTDINKTGLPEPGEVWWFKTSSGLQPVKVIGANQVSENQAMIALEDLFLNRDFLPNRQGRIYVIYRRMSGITIPRRAIYRDDGISKVKILKGDGFELKKVRVIEADDNNAIIDGVEFGAIIISR
jgi:putative membrane fusion protein